ncbi:magnesium-transporting ATPase, partial [filamentous cyanobacterium CCP5]
MSAFSNSPSNQWHTLKAEQAAGLLETGFDGLGDEQVGDRQRLYGLNELQEGATRSPWEILWDQFKNIMLLMLIAVALVSLVLDLQQGGFPKDAIAIFAIVILNGLLGYLQETKAEKALAALKTMTSSRVRVIRSGREQEVDAKELVPGDIALLEAGGQVPADGRLVNASNLQVREAALTGEAEAVTKQPELTLSADAALGDRLNLVFQGTEVIQGRGTVLVTQTGMQTELGRIATMIQSVENEPTPLQQRMGQLGNVLVSDSLVLVALVVVTGLLRTGDLSLFDELLEVSLSMAVAVVPEGLPAVITVTLALGTQRMVRRRALIRKLPAVETLGSVTTICSDKTGTLTQNKMVVQQVQTGDRRYKVTGEGYAPTGYILDARPESSEADSNQADLETAPALESLLIASALCNDATLNHTDDGWVILGDPTEGALLALAGKGGFNSTRLRYNCQRIGEIPFSSERKRMSVVMQPCQGETCPLTHESPVMFTKGSPELILERCQFVQTGQGVEPLSPELRQQVIAHNDQMAAGGLRVLGFAMKPLPGLEADADLEAEETDLIWLGLAGMLDAPRPEVRSAGAG